MSFVDLDGRLQGLLLLSSLMVAAGICMIIYSVWTSVPGPDKEDFGG